VAPAVIESESMELPQKRSYSLSQFDVPNLGYNKFVSRLIRN
jgi:hypothetical protein